MRALTFRERMREEEAKAAAAERLIHGGSNATR
jgi:hypothetical protein